MDKIIISGIELWLRLGCTAAERAFPQRVEMDLELELPLAEAGRSDDLAKTVDYAKALSLVRSLGRGTYRLAEAAAEDAASRIVRRWPALAAVTVRIRKRALPGIAWAGVEIRRAGRAQPGSKTA